MESYTFISKRNGQEVTAHKFECWLIGNNAQQYCVGFVKGTEAQCKAAKEKVSEDNCGDGRPRRKRLDIGKPGSG